MPEPTGATLAASSSTAGSPGRPYPPSLLDRLLDRIDGLPGHGWWLYLVLVLAGITYVHLVVWGTGRVPFGQPEANAASTALYGPYALAAIHYLDRAGRRAMREFRLALNLTEEEAERRAYELVTLPGGPLVRWVAVGLVIGVVALVGADTPGPGGLRGLGRLEVVVRVGPTVLFGFAMLSVLTYHTVRQLRLVDRIHREAPRIDPLLEKPLFAFSRLTMRTAVVFLLIGYYLLTVNGAFITRNPVALPILAGTFVVGIACFVLPLRGIHDRLVAERERLVAEANDRILLTRAELYRRIDAGELVGSSDVSDALGGAIAARELVRGLTTWPWPPDVLSVFVTALVLPILVFVVTSQLGSVFT